MSMRAIVSCLCSFCKGNSCCSPCQPLGAQSKACYLPSRLCSSKCVLCFKVHQDSVSEWKSLQSKYRSKTARRQSKRENKVNRIIRLMEFAACLVLHHYAETQCSCSREMLKLHRSGEHGGVTGLTKESKCWERSVKK